MRHSQVRQHKKQEEEEAERKKEMVRRGNQWIDVITWGFEECDLLTPGQLRRRVLIIIPVVFCNASWRIRTLFECFWHLSKFCAGAKFEFNIFADVSIDFYYVSPFSQCFLITISNKLQHPSFYTLYSMNLSQFFASASRWAVAAFSATFFVDMPLSTARSSTYNVRKDALLCLVCKYLQKCSYHSTRASCRFVFDDFKWLREFGILKCCWKRTNLKPDGTENHDRAPKMRSIARKVR